MDAAPFRELAEVMAGEAECYRQLASLAGEQHDLLVASKVETLAANVKAGEKRVFELGPLVARRNELLGIIARSLGGKQVDLGRAVEAAPDEVSEGFREAAGRLVRAARDLEALNRGNDKLLRNALDYVNFTLRAVRTAGRPQAAPRPGTGETSAERPAPAFVNRQV